MAAYPSVNWWPGNLRPYESRLSFVTRFCGLNGVSTRQCVEFLRIDPESNAPLPIDEIRRLTSVLGETTSRVEEMFSPAVRFVDLGLYGPSPERRERDAVRYCETCAQHGYHSQLHQPGWLARCPFHMSGLKKAWVKKRTSSLLSNHVGALDFVMRQHCRSWPHGVDAGFPGRDQGHVASLVGWVARASAAAARMSHGEIWWSGGDAIRWDVSLEQAFGQLRALEAMPEEIEPLFAEAGGRWSLEARAFARQAKDQLDHLRSRHLGFAEVVHFYIRVNAASANPPSFVTRLNAFQDRLKTRHGSCRCWWWLTGAGWLSDRISPHPGEGRREGADLPVRPRARRTQTWVGTFRSGAA
jgi:hypothetical protein